MAASFTDKMRQLVLEARSKNQQNDDSEWKTKKTLSDITRFFNVEVKKNAMKKIEERASKGCNSANLLEYGFKEYFYISKEDGKIVRVPQFERVDGHYLHRIHDVVFHEHFQKLLQELVDTMGEMCYACRYVGKNINVVEFYWGPTKYHDWDAEKADEAEAEKSEAEK